MKNETQTPATVAWPIGLLLLLQLITALTLPFILSSAITLGSPAYLPAVAADAFQVRSAILISLVGSALTVYLGIRMYPVFSTYSKSVAVLFLLICAISCTLDLVHAGTMLSMLSISKTFVASDATGAGMYNIVAATVASARRSAHVVQLLAIGAWMFVFYMSLFRFKLIPPALALIGIIGVTLQFTGVTLMMLLGQPAIGQMAMPLLPIHVTAAVWLMVKGFRQPRLQPSDASVADRNNLA